MRGPDYVDATKSSKKWIGWVLGFACLVLLAGILYPIVGARVGNRQARDLAYATLLDRCILQFAQDYHSTPEMRDPNAFKSMLMPYVKTPTPFEDPVSHRPYIPNPMFTHIDLTKLIHPEQDILVSSPLREAASQRVVAYADGHVQSISETKFHQLIEQQELPVYVMGPLVGNWAAPHHTLQLSADGAATLSSKGVVSQGLVVYNGLDRLTGSIGKMPFTGDVEWESIDSFKFIPQKGAPITYNRVQKPTSGAL